MNSPNKNPLARVAQLAAGARNLGEWWISENPPVAPDVAQSRASTCIACPLNQNENLFSEWTGKAALAIKRAFERKSAMNLQLPDESKLQICDACGCELKLKVWEPIDLIKSQMSEKNMNSLHPDCWILE